MKLIAYLAAVSVLVLAGCSRYHLPSSKYASAMSFEYKSEQPVMNFTNRSLNIAGAWWWGSFHRAMPNPNYLTDTVRRIIKPFVKEHGPVLFSTFDKERKKLRIAGYVPVKKEDVRSVLNLRSQSYISVLINETPFDSTNHHYSFKERSKDYQFSLYEAPPIFFENNWIIMEVIATSKERYFTFVCILDKSHAANKNVLQYQYNLFYQDIKRYFGEMEE